MSGKIQVAGAKSLVIYADDAAKDVKQFYLSKDYLLTELKDAKPALKILGTKSGNLS